MSTEERNFVHEGDPTASGEAVKTAVRIDVWSDVICPWCYIGKRRLERAIADSGADVEVTYHSFELSPDTPTDYEGSAEDYLAHHKGMGKAQVAQMLAQVTELAKAEGLNYDFANARQTKTLKAHELLHFALNHGRQDAVKERLLSGYFERGEHIGQIDVLTAIAAEVGLPDAEARVALEEGTFEAAVAADIAQARAYGISGVPFFVFNEEFGVSGAQPVEVFVEAIRQASGGVAEPV